MGDKKIIIILVVVQLILCCGAAVFLPISLDEPFSIYHAQLPFQEMISGISEGNNSPLHFVLLHFWIKIGGIGVFWVRLLSILISSLSIVVLYKLGRKFWNKRLAVLFVSLFILARPDHYVAMEVRMYGLFTLFFVLLLYHFRSLLFEDKKVYIQLALWNTLLLYTHYLGIVVIAMECIIFVGFYKKWNRAMLKQVSLIFSITFLLFLPWIQFSLTRIDEFQQNGTWVQATVFNDFWTVLVKLMNNQFTLIACLLILGILWYLNRFKASNSGDKSNKTLVYFGSWFLGTYLFLYLFSIFVQPVFVLKYLQFLTVPLLGGIVAIIARFQFEGKLKYMTVIIIIPFLLSFKFVPDIDRNTDELVDYVMDRKIGDCNVYYCPPHYELTLAYHYNSNIFKDYKNLSKRMEASGFIPVYTAQDILEMRAGEKIIYIDFDSKMLYPDNEILTHLDATTTFLNSRMFDGNFAVYEFEAFKQ